MAITICTCCVLCVLCRRVVCACMGWVSWCEGWDAVPAQLSVASLSLPFGVSIGIRVGRTRMACAGSPCFVSLSVDLANCRGS